MITQEYQPNEVSSTVKPGVKHPSVGVMRGVVIINRSPWWMEAKLGPQRLFIIPAWHEAGFTVPEQSNDFTLSVYSEASGPILDFDVPTIPHGIWVDGEAYVEKAYLTPLVVGNVPLLGSGEGTGSQPVVLTGSLAPLNPLPPVLVATVPYSSLTASSAFFVEVTTLHANARERAWTVNNTLNEPLSGLKFAPFDTASNALSTATTLNAQEESSPTPPGSGNYVLYESRNIPILGTATDSMRVELDMGATAPTSGNVYVVVREVL